MTGDLNTKQPQRQSVNAQHRLGKGQQFCVGGKDGGKHAGEQLDQQAKEHGVANAASEQQSVCVAYAITVSRTVIVADNGLSTLSKPLQRQHGKLHDTGENGHGTHCQIAAVFQQRGVEAYGDHALAGLHDEQGTAQRQTRQNNLGVQTQIAPANTDKSLFAK